MPATPKLHCLRPSLITSRKHQMKRTHPIDRTADTLRLPEVTTPGRLFAFAALLLASLAASAQDAYPAHPITLVVPFPPGGVADIVGRPFADALSRELKTPVVIENKPG